LGISPPPWSPLFFFYCRRRRSSRNFYTSLSYTTWPLSHPALPSFLFPAQNKATVPIALALPFSSSPRCTECGGASPSDVVRLSCTSFKASSPTLFGLIHPVSPSRSPRHILDLLRPPPSLEFSRFTSVLLWLPFEILS